MQLPPKVGTAFKEYQRNQVKPPLDGYR